MTLHGPDTHACDCGLVELQRQAVDLTYAAQEFNPPIRTPITEPEPVDCSYPSLRDDLRRLGFHQGDGAVRVRKQEGVPRMLSEQELLAAGATGRWDRQAERVRDRAEAEKVRKAWEPLVNQRCVRCREGNREYMHDSRDPACRLFEG